jgi:hypothetical protein
MRLVRGRILESLDRTNRMHVSVPYSAPRIEARKKAAVAVSGLVGNTDDRRAALRAVV